MSLIKYRLGDCVELYSERCGNPNLTVWDISAVNSDKEFFEANRYEVKNGNDPTPGNPTEEKQSELEDFIDYSSITEYRGRDCR